MPVTALECLAGVDIVEPHISPDGRWLAVVLNAERGAFLYRLDLHEHRHSSDQQPAQAAILYAGPAWSPGPVRSGRSLGGGAFTWLPNSTGVVVVARSGELWLLAIDNESAGESRLVLEQSNELSVHTSGGAMSSPAIDPTGRYVAITVDQAQVWTVEIATGRSERVDAGDGDFVSDPVWWNGRPHWVTWSVPHMPWDTSAIVNESGERFGPHSCQVQQPQVATSGPVWGWLDDSSGWLNVQIANGIRIDEQREHGGPSWGERQRSWCLNSTGTEGAFVRNEDGFGRLCSFDIATGKIIERGKAIHGQLSWVGDTLVALRTGAKTPTRVVAYETSGAEWKRRDLLVGSSEISGDHPSLVEPELIESQTADGVQLFGRLYHSPTSRGRLLCWIHGGPTDQWTVSFMPRLVYWLDRGYDILVPDHRGSTGHGRVYTQSLHEGWGDVDVADVSSLVNQVLRTRGETALAFMGSSAGGMTALALLARHPGLARAAVVAYPVSDIAALDEVTHRFEAHYNRSLMGTPEQTSHRSRDRSPSHHPEAIAATPLLIFHGTEDPVVPKSQSDQLVQGLRDHGGHVEYVVFEGEGHGFRQLDNKVSEYERTEEFLNRYLDG